MSAEGLCLEVTYLGPGSGPFLLNDVHDAFDARNQRVNNMRPGPLYLHPNVAVELIYTSDVAKSFEIGAIRKLLTEGRATVTFATGPAFQSLLGSTASVPISGAGLSYVMTQSGVAVVDTSVDGKIIYLPPLELVAPPTQASGSVTIAHAIGVLDAEVRPAIGSTTQVAGGAQITVQPGEWWLLLPDLTNNNWIASQIA